MNSIWIPRGDYFNWGSDRPDWEPVDIYLDENPKEFHWFATKEACQAECDRRNEAGKAALVAEYDAYVENRNETNELVAKGYEQQVAENKALIAAGLREPGHVVVPTVLEYIKPFKEWSRWKYSDKWEPAELSRSEVDA